MKINTILFILILSPIVSADEKLLELFKTSEENHQIFKQNALTEKQTQERVNLLKSNLGPEISLEGTMDYGNKTLTHKSGLDRWDSELKLKLTQDLYNGGKEYSYFDLKEILPRITKESNAIRKLDHFERINTNYFQYKKASINYKNLEKQIRSLEMALQEVHRRSKIGRVSRADYYSGLAQLERLKANLLALEEQVLMYRSMVEQLIGVPFEDQFTSHMNWSLYRDIEPYWKNKVIKIPQIRRVEAEIENKKESVDIIKANYRPTISLVSNAYLDKRTNSRDSYDVAINLSWSLFSFGQTNKEVEIERAEIRIAEAEKDQLKKDASIIFSTYIKQHQRRVDQIERYETAYRMSQKSYQFQKSEYDKGLLNYIELSRSLDDLIEAEKQYNNSINDLAMHWYSIKIFLGDV